MKIISIVAILISVLSSCNGVEKTSEQKLEDGFKEDISELKSNLYNTPIGSDEFIDKANSFDDDVGEALLKNMYKYEIDQLLDQGDDLSIPRDIKYSISIFDNSKSTDNIDMQLKEKGYRIEEKKDVFGMAMFYVMKEHPVDLSIITKDEEELNIILKEEWISYDGWTTDVAGK